jgi:hypothetical protein
MSDLPRYGVPTVIAGVIVTEITPAQVHMHFEELLRPGAPPTNTVGIPGAQGAVTGTHGPGTGAPKAAARAAMTAGLAGELHIPKGTMFTNGLLSRMLAIG